MWVWSVQVHLYAEFLKIENMVESTDAEPWIQRNHGYGGPTMNYTQIKLLPVVQWSTVMNNYTGQVQNYSFLSLTAEYRP